MGSSSTPSTTTQTSEPPAFIRPFLQAGAQESLNAYRAGGPQYYPGNTVVPFSPQTEQALGMTERRAMAGSPVTQAAQGYATKTLNGDFLNKNPYLDHTFNRAADQVQNRLNTGFAASGRNIDAGRAPASQELNDLSQQIYGGAYENERQRQQAMVPFANQLANQDYFDIEQLRGVGGQVEDLTGRLMEDQAGRWDFAQNAPQQNLDRYLGRVTGAFPGQNTTQTTPTYRNRTAGALGGAATGAQAGMVFGAPWLGAIAGGLLGAFG